MFNSITWKWGSPRRQRYSTVGFKCMAAFQQMWNDNWSVYSGLRLKEAGKGKIMHLLLFSSSVVSDSLQFHGLQPTRLLRLWDFPGKNTGVGWHFLLQGIFLTQRLNPHLLHCRWILHHLNHRGRVCILDFKHLCRMFKSWVHVSALLSQSFRILPRTGPVTVSVNSQKLTIPAKRKTKFLPQFSLRWTEGISDI